MSEHEKSAYRPADLLDPCEASRIHEASLEILEEVGVRVRSEKARRLFRSHGCSVDTETHIIRIPSSVVEDWRQAFPHTFTLHGRDADWDRTVPDDGPLISTTGAAPNVIDLETGEQRRALVADIADMAHLVNELPGLDVFSIPTTADDAPDGRFHLSRFYPALRNCVKPVTGSAPNAEEAHDIFRLGCLIAGGEDTYRERPFITYISCPVVSPLTLDAEPTEMLLHFTEQELPAYSVITPSAGLTAPLTLTGCLAQSNAEFLTHALLRQMARTGTPLIYFPLPAVTDVRSGAYASGAVETGMLVMACAQMARYYGVPSAGYAGLTNAKVNDAQAGFETGISATAAVLAGVDLIKMSGLIDALMAFDFAKTVIDDEIAQMLKRMTKGFGFGEHNLALDVIASAGPGGMFIDKEHTIKHMRDAMFFPEIADRQSREDWQAGGAESAHSRAAERVTQILAQDNSAVFSRQVEDRIKAEFEGLVLGQVS